jgi:hypothetical protein
VVACAVRPTGPLTWGTLVLMIPCAILAGFVSATMPPVGLPFLPPNHLFFV